MKFLKKVISAQKLTALVVALLFANFLDPAAIVFAETGAVGDTASTFIKGFGEIASIFVNVLTFIAILFLNYGGKLIGTDLLTGKEVMEAITPMWVIMRNFTNIGFVLLMIFLAMSNLFSSFGEGGNWTIKDKLPKIIFSLIAINFSLLAFKVVIDAVHVGTVGILSISDRILEEKGSDAAKTMLGQTYDNKGKECTSGDDCKNVIQSINEVFCKPLAGQAITAENVAAKKDCSWALNPEGFTTDPRDQSARNLFMAFGIQFQHLGQLPKLAANLDSWTKVIDSTLFSMIMALAFVIAIVALFVVLLVRIVVLWLGMVFSPLLMAGAIMGFGGEGSDMGKKIITNLIVPLKVAAVFAITFVLISALSTVEAIQGVGAGGKAFIFFGPALSKLGNEYAILWQIMTVIVFWTAVFKAMEGSAAQGIVDKIKSGAQTVGGYVAKSQTIDKPMLPWFGKDPISLSTLSKFPQAMESANTQKLNKEYQQITEFVGGNVEIQKSLDSMNETISSLGGRLDPTKLKQILGSEKNMEALQNNETMAETIAQAAKKGGAITSDAQFKVLKNGLAANTLDKQKDEIGKLGIAGLGKDDIGKKETDVTKPEVKVEIGVVDDQTNEKHPIMLKMTEGSTELKILPQATEAESVDEINDYASSYSGIKKKLETESELNKVFLYLEKVHKGFKRADYELKDGKIVKKTGTTTPPK